MEIGRSPDKNSAQRVWFMQLVRLSLGWNGSKKSCQMQTSSSKANISESSKMSNKLLSIQDLYLHIICILADRFFVWTSYFLQAPNDFQRQRVLFGESCSFHRGRRMKKQNLSEAMILKSIFPALSWQVIGNLLEENFIKIHPCWSWWFLENTWKELKRLKDDAEKAEIAEHKHTSSVWRKSTLTVLCLWSAAISFQQSGFKCDFISYHFNWFALIFLHFCPWLTTLLLSQIWWLRRNWSHLFPVNPLVQLWHLFMKNRLAPRKNTSTEKSLSDDSRPGFMHMNCHDKQ